MGAKRERKIIRKKLIAGWNRFNSGIAKIAEERFRFVDAGHEMARQITCSPGYHWFGYNDKRQVDASGRYALAMRVDFENRSPRIGDRVDIGICGVDDNGGWRKVGTSTAWCWQQGCMLQWLPGSNHKIIWNDRSDGKYVARIYEMQSGATAVLPTPIYTISPDGSFALTTDFRRINEMRPGYGYAGIPDPNRGVMRPDNAGIWRVDMQTGATTLILSIADVAKISHQNGNLNQAKHYFNHLLISPDGNRFAFLHRWRFEDDAFHGRMATADTDGGNVRIIDDSGMSSHFCWRDERSILAFTKPKGRRRGFYLFNERDSQAQIEIKEEFNGHCSYLPGNEWIVSDTYPIGKTRLQHLYLYHVRSKSRYLVGSFGSPESYKGEYRCDLHPRITDDGSKIFIDSPHSGDGRQIYMLDIGEIVNNR